MEKKRRTIFQLETPYSAIPWPEVTLEDQETILELLCALLSPLGAHRANHLQHSKGKRDRKRKRKERRDSTDTDSAFLSSPTPELSSYVDVGLSAITRRLQKTSSAELGLETPEEDPGTARISEGTSSPFYSTVLVARSGQSNVLNAHLPQMVAVASKCHPARAPIRLVGLSRACEDRLSDSLGLPRVSCIGLFEDAPNSKALVDFIQEHVPVVEATWLDEARKAEFRQTRINAIETAIGSRKQRRKE